MDAYVWWRALENPGMEQLHLVEDATGVVADSVVLGREGAIPFRLRYHIWTDSAWNFQECLLQVGDKSDQTVHLYADGQGHWRDDAGGAVSALDGCRDIDITCTPFTNTLPLRRLTLVPGESVEILVAYINMPDLAIRPARQRYTCLSRTASGGVYRYEGLETNFTADLPVDAQGLVIDYPGLWQRLE